MALMTDLQTLHHKLYITFSNNYWHQLRPTLSKIRDTDADESWIVLMTIVSKRALVTCHRSHRRHWGLVTSAVVSWHRRSEWPDKPLIIIALLSAIVVSASAVRGRVPRDRGFINSDQEEDQRGGRIFLSWRMTMSPGLWLVDSHHVTWILASDWLRGYHDEWRGSQWIMAKLLYQRIIMPQ